MAKIYYKEKVLTETYSDVRQEVKKLKGYKRQKCILLLELGVKLCIADVKHIASLANDIQVDNYAHSLILM